MQPESRQPRVDVVLFSGGRGSQVLSEELIANPRVRLTVAINGYDDGASTGEVRRFLGDALGPSDFRKNASRMAVALQTCPAELVALLDLRFPDAHSPVDAATSLRVLGGGARPASPFDEGLETLAGALPPETRDRVVGCLGAFRDELDIRGRDFEFGDCSLGNLVFAGLYLECGRGFNAAVDAYVALVGLPTGLIENVTEGANAWLVALDREGKLLASEAQIVDASRRNHVHDIYLVDAPPDAAEQERLAEAGRAHAETWLAAHSVTPEANPRLLAKLAAADFVIYAPGTQHSSLLPSYLTRGIGDAIAHNLAAIKLLVTNLREDAEIPDLSAVELVERVVHYLKEKGQRKTSTPCLVTHTLLNDARSDSGAAPYVPLGRVDAIEDPRLVRIANFEYGSSGRHDAHMLLTPFIQSFARRGTPPRVAVLLLETESLDKIGQTLLEALRSGLADSDSDLEFFYACPEPLEGDFSEALPFSVHNVWREDESPAARLLDAARSGGFDDVVLFESSGMYRGEEIADVVALLHSGRLDSAWGSRRFSVRHIHESYKLRYRKNPILGAISYVGSHVLSLAYLALYGRYVNDTLVGVRGIRARYLDDPGLDLAHKRLNQRLLSRILREGGEFFETPVRFFSMSPDKVTRTTVLDGLESLVAILWWRLRPLEPRATRAVAGEVADTRPVPSLDP